MLWAGYGYRVLTMVVYAAIGIALTRWWLGRHKARGAVQIAVGGTALLLAAAMLAAEQAGVFELVPYSGTHLETFLDVLLVTGTLGLGLALARLLPAVLAKPVAAMGAMTLTLYSLQILRLAYDVRVLHPMLRDDSWVNLAVLTVGSLAIAVVWSLVVRPRMWRRGPLEGFVSVLARP